MLSFNQIYHFLTRQKESTDARREQRYQYRSIGNVIPLKHHTDLSVFSSPQAVAKHMVAVSTNVMALSSYVFIAANVILHASATVQSCYLVELIPPIIPLLTSHHHSLRGFTQLLVYQVLFKLLPPLGSGAYEIIPLEKRSFEDLKSYLANNSFVGVFQFFASDQRIKAVRKMIMAVTPEQRKTALDVLLPYQRSDFEGLFSAMDG